MAYQLTFKYASANWRGDKIRRTEAGTGETSGEETGQTTPLFSVRGSVRNATLNMYAFFNANNYQRKAYLLPQLKPELTPEEKELLLAFLKVLDLTFDEFKLKLPELKMSLKAFTQNLKENLGQFQLRASQIPLAFVSELRKKGLLPETLFQKLDAQELVNKQKLEAEAGRQNRLSPFSIRPRPLR